MKAFSFILITSVLLISCKKDKTPQYPDCFAQLTATHTPQGTFGNGQVISLSDTSALIFYLNDEQLGIGTGCENVTPAEAEANGYFHYAEWALHTDSIPPDLAGDVLYPNTSSYRSWKLTSGNIRYVVSKAAADRDDYEPYSISMELTNGIFDRSQYGLPNVFISNLVIKDASEF